MVFDYEFDFVSAGDAATIVYLLEPHLISGHHGCAYGCDRAGERSNNTELDGLAVESWDDGRVR